MEFLVVKFNGARGVLINDATGEWMTNEILELQAGTYIVSLKPPRDFEPPSIEIRLRNTAVNVTRTIVFRERAA